MIEKVRLHQNMPKHLYDRQAFENMMTHTVTTEAGCWVWQGYVSDTASAYGSTMYRGRSWRVHRLSFFLTRGFLPPRGIDICHTCDNMACCNPGHLRADTHQNNLKEASEKKRLQGQLKTHCKRGHALVEGNLVKSSAFRGCLICQRGRYRKRLGWPEHLAFQDIIVPHGYGLNRETGELVTCKSLMRNAREPRELQSD